MKNENILDVISHDIPFRVKIVFNGESYGLNNKLIHENNDPLVEFYDKRYDFTENGQFVSRYYSSTILKIKENVGLCLDTGTPNWYIDGEKLNFISSWIKDIITIKELNNTQEKKITKQKIK